MNEFRTTDLALASTLVYFNLKLIGVEQYSPDKPFRKVFVFEETDTLKDVYTKFWAKELLVEPQAFHLAIKELKNRIHEMV